MSKQNQDLVNQLELRVKELTEANRHLQRHAAHLEIAAQLDQTISTDLDITTFSKQVVQKIKGLFGLHHVGIYLTDTSGQWVILNQAAGKASQKLMQAKYQLPLDDDSSIGWATKNQKPYLSYPSKLTGGEDRAFSVKNHLLPGAKSEIVLPLIGTQDSLGVLDLQSIEEQAFSEEDITAFQKLANQIALTIEKLQQPKTSDFGSDEAKLLYDVGVSLTSNLDIDDILVKAVDLAGRIGATLGEIYLVTDTNEVYFKSSITKRNNLHHTKQEELVHRVLSQNIVTQILETTQVTLISDPKPANQWRFLELEVQPRSIICAPIIVEQWRLKGIILFAHAEPDQLDNKTLHLLSPIISQITTTLENSVLLGDMHSNLRETHLMLDISRSLAAVSTFEEVYDALEQSILAAGANRCVLYTCHELDNTNVPTVGQIVFISGPDHPAKNEILHNRFPLSKYESLNDLVRSQETLVITNVETDERLSEEEQAFYQQFGASGLVINPLVAGSYVAGLLAIEHKSEHSFTHRELAIYRTLCNHTTTAIERAWQIQRTEEALAETQTLYRTGRVLAGADDLQEILQEALVEFVHSFGLDQGGITLLTSDKQFGQLRAYLEKSQLRDAEKLRFPINDNIVYQQLLLSGQPFYSIDVANDTRLAEFHGFNQDKSIKSTLQVPIIIRGETVGWIGVDAVNIPMDFSQKDIDLARALGDQIAIAIQNHWLLEQTERRAEQLKAVANVGETVTGLMDLNEVLKNTVELIRDRFGFYHVSIFLLDEHREWAVVRASTGRVGKIMVERPHRLKVGSNSIVGFATKNAMPRIALDVGEDAVHFENPLLPDTRSEMALPLLSRGVVIGALDVQSKEPNAFTSEDVETLQIMANQITTAIENAQLFEQTQRRLNEQAMLYRIGTKIGGTLQLQQTTDILVLETAEALDVAECVLTLIEEDNTTYIISNYVKEGSPLESGQGLRLTIDESTGVDQILKTKQEVIIHIDDPDDGSWAFEYLRTYHGTALIIVPILLRNEVIGLLEVYDDKPGRLFKQEDVALLDSIALQAANAIENANLFMQTQEALAEAEALYHITQQLTTAHDEEAVYKLAIDAIAKSGVDSSGLYMYLHAENQGIVSALDQIIEQKAVWTAIGKPAMPNGTRLRAGDFVIEPFAPHNDSLLVTDINDSSKITDQLRTILTAIGITSLLILPLSTHQRRLGFLLVAYKTPDKKFTEKQIRFFTTIAQQLVTTLENLHFLDVSQKRAQREEIIREITLKIRNAVDIDDILKTTVTELGKVLGTSRGNIVLDVGALSPTVQAQLQAGNGSSDNVANGSKTKAVRDKES